MRYLIGFLALAIASLSIWLHASDYLPVVRKTVAKTIARQKYMTDVDRADIKILFCGTGSPSRSPVRAGPCLALIANGELFLFDAGEGAIGKLHQYQAPVLKLKKIFLTHLHSDHMSGVAEVLHNTWLFGRTKPVTLMGPPGTEKFLRGIQIAYEDDISERMHVLEADGVDPDLAFGSAQEVRINGDGLVTVYKDENLTIEAFRVNHPDWEFAYGYRIQTAGRTIVISGDTTVSDGIKRHSRGADILIHEAMNPSFMSIAGQELEKIDVPISAARISRIADVHTSTLDLAEIASDAQVGSLILTHLIPPIPDNFVARAAFTSGMSDVYEGNITVANDGLWIDLTKMAVP